MRFDINAAKKGLYEINYYIAKNEVYIDKDLLWIYKKGEEDVLVECIKLSQGLVQYGEYNRIILITDDRDIDCKKLPHYFIVEKCSSDVIDSLITWYIFGNFSKNIFVISLKYPDGRKGRKWLDINFTISDVCKHGILRMY